MSESNLTDKVSEAITNAFKKTKVFEKTDKILICFWTFIISSSIVGLSNIYINYCNSKRLKNLEEKIESSENVLKNIEINRKKNAMCYNKIIEQLKYNISVSTDMQQILNEKLLEIKELLQNPKKELIMSTNTSVTTFSPIKSVNSMDDLKHNVIEQEEPVFYEDDELMNECYDSIPLNNVKKNTGLTWLFT